MSIHEYLTIWVDTNLTCLLNELGFINSNMTFLLNGFLKFYHKKNTNFSINSNDLNYEKPNKHNFFIIKLKTNKVTSLQIIVQN